jgi:tripartite-type tricarboxylate transporter receptor subunit TctC
MSFVSRAVLGTALALAAGTALAQAYPTKPGRVIVPFPAGGGYDFMARNIGQRLNESLGQPFVVENRAGANGNIGSEAVAKAPPDGYTLLLGGIGPQALSVALYPKLAYDPTRDFEPISLVAAQPNLLVVHPSLPVKTLKELIAFAKARPGQVRYSTTGVGAFTHYEGEVFQRRAGIKMVHIPVKEGPPAMVRDILAGDIHIASMTMSTAGGLVASGTLKPLVTSMEQRVPEYPDVPTMAESGFPRVGTPNWSMLFVPSQTPPAAQEALFQAVTGALKSDGLKAAYQKTLTYATPSASIAEARDWLKAEMERWKGIMEEVKIDIEQ